MSATALSANWNSQWLQPDALALQGFVTKQEAETPGMIGNLAAQFDFLAKLAGVSLWTRVSSPVSLSSLLLSSLLLSSLSTHARTYGRKYARTYARKYARTYARWKQAFLPGNHPRCAHRVFFSVDAPFSSRPPLFAT